MIPIIQLLKSVKTTPPPIPCFTYSIQNNTAQVRGYSYTACDGTGGSGILFAFTSTSACARVNSVGGTGITAVQGASCS